jgi:hypothetical protein
MVVDRAGDEVGALGCEKASYFGDLSGVPPHVAGHSPPGVGNLSRASANISVITNPGRIL